VPSTNGSPTFVASAAIFAAFAASSIFDRGTSIRVGALHDCPCCEALLHPLRHRRLEIRIFEQDVGRLAPSSCVTRFTVGAAATATAIPARVDPVKDTIAHRDAPQSQLPPSAHRHSPD